MSEILSALDAPFLAFEPVEQEPLIGVDGTMVFDRPPGGPPTLEDLHRVLSARIGELRRYSQRLSSLRAGDFFWPRSEPDPQFEIGHHIRRAVLPGPGDERQLCEWTADFFSEPVDRAWPLWELVLLEGLEHGRWALAHKLHHRLADGAGSVDVLGLLIDDRPGAAQPWSGRITGSRFAASSSRARPYAVVRAPLAELKAVGRVLGGSSSDVVLAACAGGLRHVLLERDERIGSRLVGLPIDEPVAAVRVARIAARSRRPSAGRAAPGPTAFSTPLFDVTITNDPGPAAPLYAFGAPLREVLPIVPLAAQDRVGIAIFSYAGVVSVGLTAGRETVPDLDALARGIEQSLEELRGYGA